MFRGDQEPFTRPSIVVQACKSSHLGDRDGRITVQNQSVQKRKTLPENLKSNEYGAWLKTLSLIPNTT
jgi:hypothetical protein